MDNTLLIHMGRHKTGTTALQIFLHENNELLEKYGWCYPDLKKELPEVYNWRCGGAEKNGDFFYKEREVKYGDVLHKERGEIDFFSEDWHKIWEQILSHLEGKNVILSEEALWYVAEEFLINAKEKFKNIKVIIYLRRQDTAMESWWNQMIKGTRYCCKTFHEYLKSDGMEEIENGFHYLKKLDQISRIIGKENLVVRAYEKQQLKGEYGIISDFLSILDIDLKCDGWKEYPIHNTRLYGNFIEIKRIFNTIRQAGYPDLAQYMCFFEKISSVFGKKDEGYFNQEDRKSFYSLFTLENEQIARKYLHREDGILFYDDRMDFPQYDMKECSSFEADLIRFFSVIICDQNEKIKYLEKQNDVFIWRLMLNNKKSRELIFFGAGQKCRELLNNTNIPVKLIADNDKDKEGQKIYGEIKIIHPKTIEDWTGYFVVVTCVYTDEIEKQLQKTGLKKDEDYVLAKEFFLYD